jgi:hypothetical protein
MVQQFEQREVHRADCKSKENPGKAGSRLPSAHRFELRPLRRQKETLKNGSFSLIERVILSAGAMLIFSVSFQD